MFMSLRLTGLQSINKVRNNRGLERTSKYCKYLIVHLNDDFHPKISVQGSLNVSKVTNKYAVLGMKPKQFHYL